MPSGDNLRIFSTLCKKKKIFLFKLNDQQVHSYMCLNANLVQNIVCMHYTCTLPIVTDVLLFSNVTLSLSESFSFPHHVLHMINIKARVSVNLNQLFSLNKFKKILILERSLFYLDQVMNRNTFANCTDSLPWLPKLYSHQGVGSRLFVLYQKLGLMPRMSAYR